MADIREEYIREMGRILDEMFSHLNTIKNYEFTDKQKHEIEKMIDSFSDKIDTIET